MGKRGTPCSICNHKHRPEIEYALVAGTSLREIGRRFGASWYAIGRHGRAHMPPQARAAILAAQRPEAVDLDAMREAEATGLLAQLVSQRARLFQQGEAATAAGDTLGAVAVEKAIGSNLALTGKLLGQLISRVDVRHAHLTVSPDYLRLRQILMGALRAFPDAARAVAADLAAYEAEAARDITDTAAKRGRAPTPALIEHDPAPSLAPLAHAVMTPPPPPVPRRPLPPLPDSECN